MTGDDADDDNGDDNADDDADVDTDDNAAAQTADDLEIREDRWG